MQIPFEVTNSAPSCCPCSPPHPLSLGTLWEFVSIKMLLKSQLTILCTEETSEILVVSEEEPQRNSLQLLQEPGQEQAAADRPVGRRGFGGARELGQTTLVPAALLENPKNQEPEDPERDQLIIRDSQEEQDATEGGMWGSTGCPWLLSTRHSVLSSF